MTFLILIALVLCSCSSFTRESKQSDIKPSSANTASSIQVTQTPIPSPTAAISIEPSIQPETSKQPRNLNLTDPKTLLGCTYDEFTGLLNQKKIKYQLDDDRSGGWTLVIINNGSVKNIYSFTTIDSLSLRLVIVTATFKGIKNEIIKKADSLYGKANYIWKDEDANLNMEYFYEYDIDPHTYYTLTFNDQGHVDECYSTYSLDGSTPPSID